MPQAGGDDESEQLRGFEKVGVRSRIIDPACDRPPCMRNHCIGAKDCFRRRRRRELLAPRLLRQPRSGAAATGWSLTNIYYHTSVSAGGDVSLAREFEIKRVPGNLSATATATFSGSLSATGDLGIVMPTYTFATPVFGGQATVGVLGSYGVVSTSLAGTLAGALSVPPFGSLPFSRFDSISDSVWGFGDVMPIATLRWNPPVQRRLRWSMVVGGVVGARTRVDRRRPTTPSGIRCFPSWHRCARKRASLGRAAMMHAAGRMWGLRMAGRRQAGSLPNFFGGNFADGRAAMHHRGSERRSRCAIAHRGPKRRSRWSMGVGAWLRLTSGGRAPGGVVA